MTSLFKTTLTILLCNNILFCSASQIDSRLTEFHKYIEFEKQYEDCILAGDKRLEYISFNENTRQIRQISDGNYFGLLCDLSHDLKAAENKVDFGAVEMISSTILDLMDGKYGLTPIVKPVENQNLSDIFDELKLWTDMTVTHSAQALHRVAIQKKTTEKMQEFIKEQPSREALKESRKKKNMANNTAIRKTSVDTDINRPGKIAIEQNKVGLDAPIYQYLIDIAKPSSDAARASLLISKTIFNYRRASIREMCEFAVLLMNPIHIQKITEFAFDMVDESTHLTAMKADSIYEKAVNLHINKTFSIDDHLKEVANGYFQTFLKLSWKIVKQNQTTSKRPLMKIKESGGADVFGSKWVCRYDSRFELFKQNPGNKHLITVGNVYSIKEMQEKLHGHMPNGYMWYFNEATKKWEYHNFQEPFLMNDLYLDLYPTNDLQSRSRVRLAEAVWRINQNNHLQKWKYLKDFAKKDFMIYSSENYTNDPLAQELRPYIIKNAIDIPLVKSEEITGLHAMRRFHHKNVHPEAEKYVRYLQSDDKLYSAFGMNILEYSKSSGPNPSWIKWAPQLLLEMSAMHDDMKNVINSAILYGLHIINPFVPVFPVYVSIDIPDPFVICGHSRTILPIGQTISEEAIAAAIEHG
ncbi:MAG: hypothetical protein LBP31_00160 [Holosporales bacterium]|jgi:hypothetical protein|nr:hypothetical protein [Holosporales bacterium]